VIIGEVWSIRTFSVVGEVCSLVSTRVKLVYSLPPSFFELEFSLHILSALMGSLPFVESFILEAF
jgi:hypothetical protein